MTLSNPRMRAVTFIPFVGATLSISGNALIIGMLLRERKQTPYRRLLFAMSMCDILSWVLAVFLPILVPVKTSHWIYAIGNEASCSFLGMMVQFSFSNFSYAGMLSLYFLLSVVFGWKQHVVTMYAEPWMHLLAIGWPLITAVYTTSRGMMHELVTGPGCWISDWPTGCEQDETTACRSMDVGMIVAAYPIVCTLLLIAVNNILIVWAVRRTFGSMKTMSDAQIRRLRAVSTQAFLYILAFAVSWVFPLWLRLSAALNDTKATSEGSYFPLILGQAIFAPLQGFLNLFVALRPKFFRVRYEYLRESRLWCFRRALYGHEIKQNYGVGRMTPRITSNGSLSSSGHTPRRTAESCDSAIKFDPSQDFEA